MPEKKYKAWVFAPGRSEDLAVDMATAIATYGLPFMKSVVDITELYRRLEGGSGLEHQLSYRRPVAALLAGDAARARAMVDAATAAIGARTDIAAADFKRFAEAFYNRLPPQAAP